MQEIDRAEQAYIRCMLDIGESLSAVGLSASNFEILLIAYKEADILKVYAKSRGNESYSLLISFPVLSRSGQLGPKKKEGDKQVPEGQYRINRFNPKSKYHLSLGINYPNDYDKEQQYSGSDIFIHGGTETVGCLPIGDPAIEVLYTLASFATSHGQHEIPVYIFPFPLDVETLEKYEPHYPDETVRRWKELALLHAELQKQIK
ncbi:L,D-transpeptidase family protein [Sphingobacterium hotanense]|uniref:L,D-transpeptidase family protein n=1 Tax=Sphingobacterium hotanense TaxID=649196 RepID=UPI0021A386BD|nr:L,D-transpeptidase family protein [Sphingobacterium hotanense]MCT1525781.1 L,D-transpeptidase family protein [Sphingobacterium hotanense]